MKKQEQDFVQNRVPDVLQKGYHANTVATIILLPFLCLADMKKMLCFQDPTVDFINFPQYFAARLGENTPIFTCLKAQIPSYECFSAKTN